MFDKIETLVMELRKFEHIHICQEISFSKVIIENETTIQEKTGQDIHITMYEFVDRRKFDEYKLVLDASYSSTDPDGVLTILYNRLNELKELYTRNEE